MTDEQMDARLRAAGERWRAGAALAEPTGETQPVDVTARPRPRRSQRWIATASAAVLAVALAVAVTVVVTHGRDGAPTGTTAAPGSRLTGVHWSLLAIRTPTSPSVATVGTSYLDVTPAGRIDWYDGCNSFGATVTVTPTSLTIGRVMGTLVGCRPDSAAARSMAAVLHGSVTYRVVQNKLTITKAGRGALIFVDASHTGATRKQLFASSWKLAETQTSYSHGNSAGGSGSSALGHSTVVFSPDGTFTVAHRCYTDKGSFVLEPTTMTLTGVTLLRAIPCASNAETPDGQRQNDFVDNLLKGTARWHIVGGRLTITKGNDSATFTPG